MNAWLPRARMQWIALIIGAAALGASWLLGWRHDPRQALLSYLFAFLFFAGLSVGSLALLMMHALTGGAWGWYVRPQLLAAARVLPLTAVLALPVLIGLHDLYDWSRPVALASAALLRAQGWYLDATFFVLRTLACFALWIGWLVAFARGMDDPARARRIAAPGLIVYALTSLLMATDWAASLTPHWHSSVFGLLVATGWMLAAAALAVLCAACARDREDAHPSRLLHDLGNVLLMFVLAWSYLAFMQYLTAWVADLPGENAWYLPRTLTSWRYLAWFLIACHFAIPFVLLLSRAAKRRRAWLGAIAAMLLAADLAEAFWLVVPGSRAQGFALRWTDLCAPLGIGGLWCGIFLRQLGAVRLPPAGESTIAPERAHG